MEHKNLETQRQITEIRNIKHTKIIIKKRMGYFYYSMHIYCSNIVTNYCQ